MTGSLAGKVFRGSSAVRRGRLHRTALRTRAWRQLFRDVYADARLAYTHGLRCQAASAFVLPADAVIAGRSAAHLFGVPYVDVDDPVEVLAAKAFGPVKGMTVHQSEIGPNDVAKLGRVAVTSPLRTAWDLAVWLELAEAMVFLDFLAARHLIDAVSLGGYVADRSGRKGCERARRACDLIDPGAQSPAESRLRVALVLAGLPKPVTQYVVTRDGRFVARVDLAFPEWKIAVEYDGRWHGASAEQFERDRHRLNRLLGTEWTVFHVTARQMHNLGELVADIRKIMSFSQKMTPESASRTSFSRKMR